MTKKRFWTVVFMVGNVPRVVRRYKSLKSAYAAMNVYESTDDARDNHKRAWVVKTDNRATHKRKMSALDTNDAATLAITIQE